MKKVIKKIYACHSGLRAGIQDNKLADFLTGFRIKCGMTVLLCVCLLSLTACDNKETTAPEGKETIKIGATLPLTGNLAEIGDSAKNSIDWVLNDLKDKQTKYNYEVIIENDAFEARNVAMIVKRFISIDKVHAILSEFSIGANVVSPIAEEAKIIHLTCAYGSQPAKGEYNFNNQTQYKVQAEKMIELLRKKGIKTISLFTQNNIGSLQQTEVLEKHLSDANIIILANIKYNPGTISFREIIQKSISKGKPDIFYVDGLNPDAVLVAKNLKEITGEINLTTINDFLDPQDKSLFEGLDFVQSAYGTDDFRRQYEEKYGKSLSVCGANVYDNLDLLIWAYENTPLKQGASIPSNADVIKTIKEKDTWNGMIGEMNIDNEGIIHSKPTIQTIKNGKPVLVEEK